MKVLDFGLAKTMAADASPARMRSPTVTVDGTREGVILGTAAYMSPEQARGRPSTSGPTLGVRLRAVRDAQRAGRVSGRDGLRYHRGDART